MTGLAPLSLDSTMARLRERCLGDGKYHCIEKAANRAAAIEARDYPMPALFVVEPSYSAGSEPANASSGAIIQTQRYEVGLMSCVQNYQGRLGSEQSEDAERLRALLWSALLGFAPESGGFQYDTGQGGLLSFDSQVFIYLDSFRLLRRIRGFDS